MTIGPGGGIIVLPGSRDMERYKQTWRWAIGKAYPHPLPRMLANNYIDGTGKPIKLTVQQMRQLGVQLDMRNSAVFREAVMRPSASTTGWVFEGSMTFNDVYDFDPGNRGGGAEFRVTVARNFMPGSPFNITSESVPVSQWQRDNEATWGGSGLAPLIFPTNTGLSGEGGN